MSWITLTTDDLNRSLAGPEKAALRTVAVEGADDPLETIIAEVINEVRGYVAGNRANTLGAGATIPDKLKSAALARIRFEAFSRLPVGRSLLTEDRVEANRSAIRLLERVSEGKFAIEEPDEAASESIAGASPAFGDGRNTDWTRTTQDGL